MIVSAGQFSAGGARKYPSSKWTPVGIVVIPGTHGVLKDSEGKNQCGVMSIVAMNCDTPETGGNEDSICWGSSDTDISTIVNYNKVVITTDKTSNTATGLSGATYAYIPRQGSVDSTPTRNYSPYAPSPYVGGDYKSGGYNPSYGTTAFDTSSSRNVLADFDGRGNTDKIIEQRGPKDYAAWKPSSDAQADYPAASCCDMFHTIGTEQGDWYLPAAGELGYIMPRLYDINDTIGKLNTVYGVGVQLYTLYNYWSSSENGSGNAYYVFTNQGGVNYYGKSGGRFVRAFMRL